jgi:phage tail-like protein
VDVNGTRYHLLYGPDDWGRCLLDGETPLAGLWDSNPPPPLEWNADASALRLRREAPLFRRAGRTPPLPLSTRRGAGRDRYGNWYWIDPQESGLRFLPASAYTSMPFWSAADRAASCTPAEATAFATCLPVPPATLLLRGLAVTARHYLVVGDVTERGLLLFDLHRGGPPALLRWPDEMPFVPWDLAATPDGGVLVLDREHSLYWTLDADFRLQADVAAVEETLFEPEDPSVPRHTRQGMASPRGYALATGSPAAALTAISIEPGPDGHVLILATDEDDPLQPFSVVYEYAGALLAATYSLKDAIEVMDPALGEGTTELFSVTAHDFAYLEIPAPAGTPGNRPATPLPRGDCRCLGSAAAVAAGPTTTAPPTRLLYLAERAGKQVLAFVMNRQRLTLEPQPQFLPLRRWDGKALVSTGDQAFYDFKERWVPVQEFVECHYAGTAVLVTPLTFPPEAMDSPLAGPPEVAGRPFDSDIPGCVWHRLMLDALIPAETAVTIRARAADDLGLLTDAPWAAQPAPYHRSGGCEIPYYDPWADMARPVPEDTGTWELLFQDVMGRYLQVEFTLQGTGRATPELRALRAWYPRFSYLDHYLPAIYREEPVAASFLDRWLANMEGLYTNLEDKIDHLAEMLDPRTAPAETLQWLACWFGLALDPLWQEDRRRFLIRHADELFRRRGTAAGVEIAVRLYVDPTVDDSLFDPRCLGAGTVRIVERWLTRGVGGLAYGDPDDQGIRQWRTLTIDDVAASAHRFSVLVPHDLSAEQQAMVERIVALEKPVHTDVEVKRYWDLYRVGTARLGLDTRLGESSSFVPLDLGDAYLGDSYLPAPYPFDVGDRLVLDRDRLGDLPAL